MSKTLIVFLSNFWDQIQVSFQESYTDAHIVTDNSCGPHIDGITGSANVLYCKVPAVGRLGTLVCGVST